ncbi:MSHA pilin protein MshA [Idiomarina fontislapidosi]|uniref:Type II secretory pathway, pseudopilin n=1 Tax=Idiomarina fontislapidosi TaxID=263723 RepID=A0A432Y2K2_9GAMM|nr:type II secretion system protein [Idiomarina fontislapidosi]PYE33344.1 MSHA pilin protein MshA [Idiomarina fontislapidosi]RUO55178.1 Type II secretory pathway, pseudopilin [Idiomarina fontislapidosi]
MRNQKGFTLIELIIVIVVLGILAVTAAPQFFNFSGDARESAVKGLKGNIQGAYQTVYAKAAIEGKLGDSDTLNEDTTSTDDDIALVYGYPAATDDGIGKASNLDSQDWDILAVSGTSGAANKYYVSPEGYTQPATSGDPLAESDYTSGNCYAVYSETSSADAAPVVTAETSGCGN